LRHLGVIAGFRGDLEQAVSFTTQAESMYRRLGSERGLQVVADDQAIWALERGDFARARALFDEALERARTLESGSHTASAVYGLGLLALCERRDAEAVRLFADSLTVFLRSGRRVDVPQALYGLASAAARRDDFETAACLMGAAEAIGERIAEIIL